jgi:hypothetical protein
MFRMKIKLKTISSFLFALSLFMAPKFVQAQIIKNNPFQEKQGHLVSAQFQVTAPGGDLGKRFGVNQSIGVDWRYKTKNNITFGLEYNWMFGNNVKELVMLDSLIGPSGEIIDKDGKFSVIRITQKGHNGFIKVGKIFPLNANKNSGIVVDLGIGFLVHKFDVMAPEATVPQLNGEYAKGYDRLTGGWAMKQFIGYQHLAPNRRANFIVGFDFVQASTQNLRNYNYDTRENETARRLDLVSSFRIGITLPIYTKKAGDEEYYFD